MNGRLVPVQADRFGHEQSIGIAISKMRLARAEINPDIAVRDHLFRPFRRSHCFCWGFHSDTLIRLPIVDASVSRSL